MPPRVLLISRFSAPWPAAAEVGECLKRIGWTVSRTTKRRAVVGILPAIAASIVLRARSYDVAYIDVFSGRAFVWAYWATRLLRLVRKPYVIGVHGGGLSAFGERWRKPLERVFRGAAVVTAPSKDQSRALSALWSEITVVPNAIDLDRYSFHPRTPARPSIVWLRAFHEIYDPLAAINVVRRLAPTFPDVRLVMVGPHKDHTVDDCRREVLTAGLAERVEIRGPCTKEEVPAVLSGGDIFLNTTTMESFGISIVEAQACGLCVVSTDVGATSEVVDDGDTGLLVDVGDDDAMARAIVKILDDPALAGRLSAGGRESVRGFDRPAVARSWSAVFLRALGR